MSLSAQQIEDTKNELKANYEKTDLTVEDIANALSTSTDYINQLFHLEPKKLEDTWILKNYLIEKVKEASKEPTPFTALGGDYHVIWFLDANYIDGGKIIE